MRDADTSSYTDTNRNGYSYCYSDCYHDSHSYTYSYCDVYTQTNATTTVASEPSPAPESLAVRRQNRIHLLTR